MAFLSTLVNLTELIGTAPPAYAGAVALELYQMQDGNFSVQVWLSLVKKQSDLGFRCSTVAMTNHNVFN